MRLFSNLALDAPTQHELTVATPLGVVESFATIDGIRLIGANATAIRELSAGGVAAAWELPQCRVEVILCRPVMPVDVREPEVGGYWAWLWRVQADQHIANLRFVGMLVPNSSAIDGGADSGENLDAQTWDDGITTLTLGTEDDRALARRASGDEWMPKRYLYTKRYDPAWGLLLIEYFPFSLHVNIGAVDAGDQVQVQFVVAWARYDEESIATWDAAEAHPRWILYRAQGYTAVTPWPHFKPVRDA
jgi:hypothetical protein